MYHYRTPNIDGADRTDKIELVSNEEVPESTKPAGDEETDNSDSDEETLNDIGPDFSAEKGIRFHLKKKSMLRALILVFPEDICVIWIWGPILCLSYPPQLTCFLP